ncbi:uncharacterized protein G2W53_012783 [Senna tora]|uniref:Uncharacterized protein n=1 Tax=Senna tora TaxID=362788 RepID=A0A834WNV9_9FABA|nr:uncharacterized protein G2W53_012783 [Senna tora]
MEAGGYVFVHNSLKKMKTTYCVPNEAHGIIGLAHVIAIDSGMTKPGRAWMIY